MWYLMIFMLISQRSILNDYNYFDLALKKCPGQNNWSMHGLWPEYNQQIWPQFCHPAKLNRQQLDGLIPELQKVWYSCDQGGNWKFWNHEYSKHGTCTGLNQSQYFQTGLRMFNYVKTNKIIEQRCSSGRANEFENCYIRFNLNLTLGNNLNESN